VQGGGAASGGFFSPEIGLFSLKALCKVAALPPAGFSRQKLTLLSLKALCKVAALPPAGFSRKKSDFGANPSPKKLLLGEPVTKKVTFGRTRHQCR
jgi:hypothetical protein